jgi:hypothetical protein
MPWDEDAIKAFLEWMKEGRRVYQMFELHVGYVPPTLRAVFDKPSEETIPPKTGE